MQASRLLPVAAMLLASLALAVWYVEASRAYYFWDYRFYHHLAYEVWQHLLHSPREMLGFVHWSLDWDINALYTLPLLPVFALFGAERVVYIGALTALYLLPFALLCGWVGARLVRSGQRLVALTASLLVLLLPPVWLPVLVGYPDVAAAAALTLAIGLYCQDPELRGWWRIAAIGSALAATMLLRRHFAYPAVVFLAAAILAHGLSWLHGAGRDWRGLLAMPLRLALAVGLMVALMLALAPEFTLRALLENYARLYESYRRPPQAILFNLYLNFGAGVMVLALLGYGLAWYHRLAPRRLIVFLLLSAGLWTLLWAGWVRQISPQYLLHLLPLVLAVGLYLLLQALRRHPGTAWLGMLIWAFMGVNFVQSLLLYNSSWADGALARALIPAHYRLLSAPVRLQNEHASDYQHYQTLVEYLQRRMRPDEQLYVAASHGLMNDDLVRSVEDTLYGVDHQPLSLLRTAHVDSRDFLPLSELLQAEYVLVTEPFLHHLPAAEQDVVRVVSEVFTESWPLSRDFEPLPQAFDFSSGFQVRLYHRIRPTTLATAIDTLRRMRAAVDPVGGQQTGWIDLGPRGRWGIAGGPGQAARLEIAVGARSSPVVYYHDLGGEIRLSGWLQARDCRGFALETRTWDPAGRETLRARRSLADDEPLAVAFDSQQPVALTLRLQAGADVPPAADCRLAIDALRVAADRLD